jgi:DNA helicase HerA-like ATPase
MTADERRIGLVTSIQGAKVTGARTAGRPAGPDPAAQEADAEFGGLVKIRTRASAVFGVVSAQWLNDNGAPIDNAQRMMSIDMLGEIMDDDRSGPAGAFRRGITVHPRLGAEIFAATPADLARVYAKPDAPCVRVGSVGHDDSLPAYVVTDGLLGKHFAVLGTTGCGKSCSVALILRSILERHACGHILLLDPHNEYATAFGEQAEVLSPANLQLPYWLMNFDELVSAFVSRDGPDRQTEMTILKHAVLEARRQFVGDEDEAAHITVDSPVPFRLGEAERLINKEMGRLNKAEGTLPYLRLLSRIEALRTDRRFEFMFSGLVVRDTLADVLGRILRVPVSGRPVTVMDLSGVPSEIVDVVVSILCRMTFDFAIWSAEAQAVPVLIVCEEAHRYVSQDGVTSFSLTREAIARIAKEGRKYGVSLCLVSQRPSELSTTILSQCNTIFALRMSNEHDQNFVRKALPDGASGLLGALPALHNREAIVVGEGVSVPMRFRFDELDAASRPRSSTASFATAWDRDDVGEEFMYDTVLRWRLQARDLTML